MLVTVRPWKKLVEELKDEGYESPYLDRLRLRLDVAERQELLEKEIAQEMAAALGRSEAKVNYALLRLEHLGRRVDAESDPAARALLVTEWNALRDEAERARHELLIHREAIGIRRNDILAEVYPIPPKRR